MDRSAHYQRAYRSLEQVLSEKNLKGDDALHAFVRTVHQDAPDGIPGFWWCGVYRVCGEQCMRDLNLAAASAPACSPLPIRPRDGGVCSDTILIEKPIVVPDVTRYPGHVVCDPRARSEITVPLFNAEGRIAGVIDVDDIEPNSFCWHDAAWIEKFAGLLAPGL